MFREMDNLLKYTHQSDQNGFVGDIYNFIPQKVQNMVIFWLLKTLKFIFWT